MPLRYVDGEPQSDGGTAGEASCTVICVAPANVCIDGKTLQAYAPQVRCVGNECTDEAYKVDCTTACEGGICTGNDACNGVTCVAPPLAICVDGTTLKTFAPSGTCSGGTCSYVSATATCTKGCQEAACVGDPCAGVICTQPPAASCANATTRRTHSPSGTCAAGACSYAFTDVACPLFANADPVCTSGVCDFACRSGFVRSGTDCVSAAPEIVLLGGVDIDGDPLGDTWTWNGTGWSQKAAGSPGSYWDSAIAGLTNTAVLFGGDGGNSFTASTWISNGASWSQQQSVGPTARESHSMATLNGTIVLYGGTGMGLQSDTWTYDGTADSEAGHGSRWALERFHGNAEQHGGPFWRLHGRHDEPLRHHLERDVDLGWRRLDQAERRWPHGTQRRRHGGARRRSVPLRRPGRHPERLGRHLEVEREQVVAADPASGPLHVTTPRWRRSAAASYCSAAAVWPGPAASKLADTWTLDGSTWTQRMVTGPSARSRSRHGSSSRTAYGSMPPAPGSSSLQAAAHDATSPRARAGRGASFAPPRRTRSCAP